MIPKFPTHEYGQQHGSEKLLTSEDAGDGYGQQCGWVGKQLLKGPSKVQAKSNGLLFGKVLMIGLSVCLSVIHVEYIIKLRTTV